MMVLNFLKMADKAIDFIEKTLLIIMISTIAILTIVNTISRNAFNYSFYFADEIFRICLILTTFVGCAYATREARHIRMSAIYDLLGRRFRKPLIIIISLWSTLVIFYLVIIAIPHVISLYELGSTSSILGIHDFLVVMWVPIFLAIVGVEYMLTIIRNLVSNDVYLSTKVPDGYETETSEKVI